MSNFKDHLDVELNVRIIPASLSSQREAIKSLSLQNKDKRVKMALNRSPEVRSNPKPSAADLFGILGPPFEQT